MRSSTPTSTATSLLFVSSLLLLAEQNTCVYGLTPMQPPSVTKTSGVSSTQLQYISDNSLEAICANTTLASLWKTATIFTSPSPKTVDDSASSSFESIPPASTQSKIPLSQLNPGDTISGDVVRVFPYGALIQTSYDIPGKTPGCVLLHNSRLPPGTPSLQVGQHIRGAHVVSLNRAKNVVHVSTRPRALLTEQRIPLGALQVGDEIQGRVTRLMDYGAFVDVGTQRDALLHKSRISTGYVCRVADHLQVGDVVTVRVLSTADAKNSKKNMSVSMLSVEQDAARSIKEIAQKRR